MTHYLAVLLKSSRTTAILVLAAFAASLYPPHLHAQGAADLQARIGELKESMARNKEALSHYTWKETVHIILKGDEKRTEHFEVRQGPDGKPVKTPLDPSDTAQQPAEGGRLRQRVVAKKKEEYREYADQMKELAQHYVPPDKDAIQDAYAKGNIAIIPEGSVPGLIKLVIHNYYKPGDTVTLSFDKNEKLLRSISVASWMDDPQDAMNLTVAFDRLPDATNHVSNVTVEGVRKQLTVKTANSDYRKI